MTRPRPATRRVLPALALSAILALTGCSPDGPVDVAVPTGAPAESSRPAGHDRTATPRIRAADVRLGVYNGVVAVSDEDTRRQFGVWPQVASSYYQPWERVDVAGETARIRRGTVPNLTLTSKGTQHLAALAGGPRHPGYDAASTWLDVYVADLATLAAVDPEVPVYATLEHEFKAKIRLGMVTGPSARLGTYARALDLFFRRARAAHPNIRVTYWIAGYDRVVEGAIGARLRVRPDAILIDPYGHDADDTITSVAGPDVAWVRRQPWYDGQEIALGELGTRVRVGDRAMARFYRRVSAQLAALGITWAVVFNRERGFDSRVTERSDGRRFPAAAAALASALQRAQR